MTKEEHDKLTTYAVTINIDSKPTKEPLSFESTIDFKFKAPQGNKEFLNKINDPKNLMWYDRETGETTPFVVD